MSRLSKALHFSVDWSPDHANLEGNKNSGTKLSGIKSKGRNKFVLVAIRIDFILRAAQGVCSHSMQGYTNDTKN